MSKSSKKFSFKDYSPDNLAEALSSDFYSPIAVKAKNHFIYLLDYFKKPTNPLTNGGFGLGIETILIEKEYYSQSYVEDFKNFHVLTHNDYFKKCKRIHFFQQTKPKTNDDLEIFTNYKDDLIYPFWESYAGYVVIRPIPSGLIGATILKPFPDQGLEGHSRVFSTSMKYNVNIFGVPRVIESLIYHEQDSLSGACATSSLWYTFYKLNDIFKTPILSPSSITIAAGLSNQNSDRLMPNSGLDLVQMRNAINYIGLEAEIRNSDEINNNRWVRGMVYSYLKFGIPVILGLEFKIKKQKKIVGIKISKRKNIKSIYHAITITGYQDVNENDLSEYFNRLLNIIRRISAKKNDINKVNYDFSNSGSDVNIKGELISKFYAHDDQIGPFSRLHFLSKKRIRTSWWNGQNFFDIEKKEIAFFHSLIIPIPQDFKIYYSNVREQVAILNGLLVNYFDYTVDGYWNIYLERSNDYKFKAISEVRDPRLPHDNFILDSLPKYIWIAEYYYDDIHLLDYLLDPTEINSMSSGLFFRYFNFDDYKGDSEHIKKYKEQFINLFEEYIQSTPIRKEKKYTLSILSIFNKLSNYLE